tara:strand:+ start:598 stop:1257 length:660 start_codon:yes stop_codon:yes gene_type:complete
MIDKVLLEKKSSKIEVEIFFDYLNNNFGDGEVLPNNHIENIFERKINHETLVEYYIDTYRTLKIMNQDTDTLLNVEKEKLLGFHHILIKDFKADSDFYLEQKFKKQVDNYRHLSCDEENYKIELIQDIKQLDWEGKYMNHCIATYRYIIVKGEYVGFKFFNKKSWERLTLGFSVVDNNLVFNQLKAHSNFPASKQSRDFAVDYLTKHKIKFSESNNDLK